MVETKAWYMSRQLWAAAIVITVGVFSGITGQNVTASESEIILGFIMIILRLITKTPVDITTVNTGI